MSILDIHDDFGIRIKTLNNMGFTLQHWGSPDWYTETYNIFKKDTRRCHWKPCRKFYEYFDEDNQAVVMYFPKGFDAYINCPNSLNLNVSTANPKSSGNSSCTFFAMVRILPFTISSLSILLTRFQII